MQSYQLVDGGLREGRQHRDTSMVSLGELHSAGG